MKPLKSVASCTIAVLALSSAANAQETGIRVSGYGTVGAVVTDTNEVQYRSSLRQWKGADKSPDVGVDSRLGVQVDYQLNDTFQAVAQVLAARRDTSETPRMEWLFAQANLSKEFSVRAGRMVLPVFLFSDTRNVGYAQHWVRVPSEMYSYYPTSSFDGGQAQWRPTWNSLNFTVQLSAGSASSTVYSNGFAVDYKINGLRGLNIVAESGDWTYRLGAALTKSRLTVGALGAVTRFDDAFYGAGVQFDNGRWLVLGEYFVRRLGDGTTGHGEYISGGYRFGSWLPYATVSRFSSANPPTGLTSALGVRWDVARNVALKAQYESTSPSTQAVRQGPLPAEVPRVHAVSLLADFVF